jgi:hypothetical protein
MHWVVPFNCKKNVIGSNGLDLARDEVWAKLDLFSESEPTFRKSERTNPPREKICMEK